jgi:hypothetical protein
MSVPFFAAHLDDTILKDASSLREFMPDLNTDADRILRESGIPRRRDEQCERRRCGTLEARKKKSARIRGGRATRR